MSVNNLEAQALVEVLTWVVERKEEIKSEIEKKNRGNVSKGLAYRTFSFRTFGKYR